MNPLASQSAQAQQSGGLAASVAGLFRQFGGTCGRRRGPFEGLKATLFPNTEFRSLFAQAADGDGISLCTKNAAPKAKTRIAYLWAYRVPGLKQPWCLCRTSRLPLGSKSTLAMNLGKAPRRKNWSMRATGG